LRRTIITLTITLATISILFGQNFKKDIKEGVYLWSSGLVIQESEDTLKIIKLIGSKNHLYKVANVVRDSIARSKMIPESDPMWDRIKPTDSYVFIKPSKIIDIIEFSKSRFAIIFHGDKGFNSANFIKRNFGYEMYFSSHDTKRRKVIESINNDTATYFMSYAFTLTDLKTLKQRKSPIELNQSDWETLWRTVESSFAKYYKLMKPNTAFGIKIDGYESNGIIEGREIILKGLLEQGYNPLEDPDNLLITRDKNERKR
jgi:hypothetical protein